MAAGTILWLDSRFLLSRKVPGSKRRRRKTSRHSRMLRLRRGGYSKCSTSEWRLHIGCIQSTHRSVECQTESRLGNLERRGLAGGRREARREPRVRDVETIPEVSLYLTTSFPQPPTNYVRRISKPAGVSARSTAAHSPYSRPLSS